MGWAQPSLSVHQRAVIEHLGAALWWCRIVHPGEEKTIEEHSFEEDKQGQLGMLEPFGRMTGWSGYVSTKWS